MLDALLRSSRWSGTRCAATAAGRRRGAMPTPKAGYDVVIVGGGGHGLATAYYLAKEHGITNVAVLEKGWIGSRQRRPQHHHHPLQLPAARQHAVLRVVDEAVGGAGAGPQLQRHGQPARRAQPLPFRRRSATPTRGAATPCGCTASMPSCSTASRCARWCPISISTTRASRSRAACCSGAAARRGTTRWPGAMRAAPTSAASTSCRTAR